MNDSTLEQVSFPDVDDSNAADDDPSALASNWDAQLTPTPIRRRVRLQSAESHESDSSKAASLGCSDSGHYSSANVSDFQAESGMPDVLRQKDQALFLALQDVRRLRSELERLSKSERWYKQELRTQKHSRLEALEKLYTNERNYMQENQRLQRECMRLYAKCTEMERELEEQRESEMSEFRKQQQLNMQKEQTVDSDHEFENVQQRALIIDQQQLIDVLRKQKRALLADLKRLTEEKDAKIFELQKSLAELEEDNRRITKKCKSLLDERSALVIALTEKASDLELSKTVHASLQVMVKETQADADSKQHELEIREREILDLQRAFKQTLQNEQTADELHRLSVEFHQQLTNKTIEIASLKNSLSALQKDLAATEDLHTQNEQQQRELEQLRSLLEAKDFELSKLHDCDAKKMLEMLKAEIIEYQSMTHVMEQIQQQKEEKIEQLLSSQESLKRTQLELISLNEKYANMCALCERCRFELEIREIEARKMQYDKQKDTEEIKELREKLASYLKKTEQLSIRINELENELDQEKLKKIELRLQSEFCIKEKQENDSTIMERSSLDATSSEDLHNKDEDFENLNCQLLQMNEYIGKLEAENGALKCFMENINSEASTNDSTTIVNYCISNIAAEPNEDDISLLRIKFQETHNFLQQLQNENEALKKIVEEGTNVSVELIDRKNDLQAVIVENLKLSDAVQSALQDCHQKTTAANIREIQELNDKLRENESIFEQLTDENKRLNTEIENLTEMKVQSNELSNKSAGALAAAKDEVRNLQLNLLKNDAKLYKLEKIKNQLELDIKDDEKCLALKEKTKKLQLELENLRSYQLRLEHEMKKKDLQIINVAELSDENQRLREKLQEIQESAADNSDYISSANKIDVASLSQEIDSEQHMLLAEKVALLELQLQQTLSINEHQKIQRIELLRQLLEQQNQKVAQLDSTQSDWEELLKTLNDTQALETNTRAALESKHAELEELNELFSEQNDDMEKLQELLLLQEKEYQEELNKMQQTFQKQIVMMQQQVAKSELKNAEQSSIIEEFKLKNLRLTKDIDEDYATEMAENKKELRLLRKQVEKLNHEREQFAERMQELEDELFALRRNKREAMIVPQIVFPDSDSESQLAEMNDELNINNNNATDDHLRILAKVLESEHQRKMSRYDLHIRALLHNIKSLKHSLSTEEQKVLILQEQQEQSVKNLQEFQSTKRHLLEARQRLDQAQRTIKTLERQLVLTRKQYESTDAGKSKRQESSHEAANLIDDYKKLIQQSAAATKRPKTSAIIDLIQRSSQCVPNLNKLESSVQELHHDIQIFIDSQYAQSLPNVYANMHRVPSLMDELKAATERS